MQAIYILLNLRYHDFRGETPWYVSDTITAYVYKYNQYANTMQVAVKIIYVVQSVSMIVYKNET